MVESVKPQRGGRPKEFQKDDVLSRAVEAFSAKGYEATSIQDLVEAMGINRFSLYEEFGGKHGLFLAALNHYHQVRRSRAIAHFDSPRPTAQLFREYLEMIYRGARKGGAFGCIMVNSACELAREDEEIAERISAHFQKLEEIFVGVLATGVKRGDINPAADLTAIARFLLNVSRGLRVMVTYQHDQAVFDDISNLALSLLCAA
jgi:TetR/AcrR family transcriptional repressor of nem operon